MHLLGAAIASLLYLLLAPAAVLAPALGDGGRTAFRSWATRLLGAVMSKLIYSFVLGVMLLMSQILTLDLTALGWFTQWLLMSTMWWGAFCRRHHVLGLRAGVSRERRESGLSRDAWAVRLRRHKRFCGVRAMCKTQADQVRTERGEAAKPG